MIRTCGACSLLLLLLACEAEDPRLPEKLYSDATRLSTEGKTLEAKTLFDQIAERYPAHPTGQRAKQDAYLLEAFYRQDINEKLRALRSSMKSISNALLRYRTKHGEYPVSLASLVPDYLDKIPETPWGHAIFCRTFVGKPVEDVLDRKGLPVQQFNTKLDRFYLASLGTDLKPGGQDLAADVFLVDGDFFQDKKLPPIPPNQPVR